MPGQSFLQEPEKETLPNRCLRRVVWAAVVLVWLSCLSFAAGADYGLDNPSEVSPFLNEVFPSLTPNAAEGTIWDVIPAFPNLTFDRALVIVPNPANDRLYVGSQGGGIRSFENDQAVATSELFLDLTDRVALVWDGGFLGMAFHPEFGVPGSPYRNYFYVYYTSHCPIDASGTGVKLWACNEDYPRDFTPGFFGTYLRLSRFVVPDGSTVADPNSEVVMLNISITGASHRGGGMVFGEDGYLYLTIGDQVRGYTAQEIENTLQGGTFRFAVDMSENLDGTWSCPPGSHLPRRAMNTSTQISGRYYCIPDDNPWLDAGGDVYEEYYSMGHRNPHRLSKDPITGRLWCGEVGSDIREEINVIEKGGNYGWPFREGLVAGPRAEPASYLGVLTDPVIDFRRDEARAIIGGYVYRGAKYPELYGRYLAGDYRHNKIWAITLDVPSMTASKQEIALFSPGALGTWGQDNNGEVFLGSVAGSGPIYQLDRVSTPVPDPPAWLSQTSAFIDLGNLETSDFFVPYVLIEPFWSDGALKSRWIAVPNDGSHDTPSEQIGFFASSDWTYPTGTVLMKHFELAVDENNPADTTRLETRFLVLGEDGKWYGFTYRWLPDQSDAELLTTAVTQDYLIAQKDGGTRSQTWLFPGRDQCLSCHNPGSGGALGPRTHQLNGDYTYPVTGRSDNQLRAWNHLGMFSPTIQEPAIPTYPRSAAKEDVTESLEVRVRSYLDSNCSYCHRPDTGNRAFFDTRFTTPLPGQGLIYGGVIDNLGIPNSHLITPGDTSTSILYHRVNSTGSIAMPPLAKNRIDKAGVNLLAEWVRSINPNYLRPPEILTPPGYVVSTLRNGIEYYLDRIYRLLSIPVELSTGVEKLIKTKNGDKRNTSNPFLVFTINEESVVYVCYDSRAKSFPLWLENDFVRTSLTVGVDDAAMDHFVVYKRTFPAGTVGLGGNFASGASGVYSNYIVIVQPVGPGAEICDNGIDDDEDGFVDLEDTDCPCTDSDADTQYAQGWCGTGVDCDDNDATIYPGASEICADNKDNDCDGAVDCADLDCEDDSACPAGADNVAPLATVTASSQNAITGQLATKAVDEIVNGYPGDYTREWVTAGERGGAWIELQWGGTAYNVNRVVFHDRPNTNDHILSGTLSFSDGLATVPVGTLTNEGSAVEVTFALRSVTWVRFTIDSVGFKTRNVGLAEMKVFGNAVP